MKTPRYLTTVVFLGLALGACSSPPPRVSVAAALTCEDLDALAPGAGAACADDDLRGVALEALTVVDARSREPIVTLDHPRVWILPQRAHVDRVTAWTEPEPLGRAASIAQLERTVVAFVTRGWTCNDPSLPQLLQAAGSGGPCQTARERPDTFPWRCESPAGDPRIVLRVELSCRSAPDAPFSWALILDRVDPI